MSTARPVYIGPAQFLRQLAGGYLVAGLIAGLGAASINVSSALEAPMQQALWHLSIGRAPLSDALTQLAKQVGIQIARFSDVESTPIVVGPLSGTYPREQALDLLLQGTGLTYRFVNDHTVAIIRRPSSSSRLPEAPQAQPAGQTPAKSHSSGTIGAENKGVQL